MDEEIKSVRESLLEATKEVGEFDPNTKAFSDKVTVNEKAREVADEAAAERFGGKESEASESTSEPTDTSVRGSIKAALREESEPTSYDVTDADKDRVGYKALPDGLKTKYSQYDSQTRDYIDQLVTDKQSLTSPDRQALREMGKVLKPYIPRLNELRASPAQLVQTLVHYAAALSDPRYQYDAFLDICNRYDIDVRAFSDPNYYVQLERHAQAERQMHVAQNEWAKHRKAGDEVVQGFAKNKEHFDAVRQTMGGLIATNPGKFIKGNDIDLDAAYIAACRAHGLTVVERKLHSKLPAQNKQQPRHKQADNSVRGSFKAAFDQHRQNKQA